MLIVPPGARMLPRIRPVCPFKLTVPVASVTRVEPASITRPLRISRRPEKSSVTPFPVKDTEAAWRTPSAEVVGTIVSPPVPLVSLTATYPLSLIHI